jgi:hypothetical protein
VVPPQQYGAGRKRKMQTEKQPGIADLDDANGTEKI